MSRKKTAPLPIPAKRALRKLGADLRDARKRRRIPTKLMAERAFVTRVTLAKAEAGEPSVSIGTYAILLFLLGMVQRLTDLADVKHDEVGMGLEEERLPRRIRLPRPRVPEAS